MCLPADDNTAFLPYDLIASCEYNQGEQWETDLQDCKNPLYVGVDIGRERDLTVIWLVESVNGVHFTRRIIELHRQTFDAQECALYELLKLRMVRRCCIDRSGLGRQFAERAQKKFGPYRVEGVDFTQAARKSLPIQCAWHLKIAPCVCLSLTPSGPICVAYVNWSQPQAIHAFAGQRNAYGHCDRFWALALALHAAKQPASGAITAESLRQIRVGSGSSRIGRRMPSFTPRTLGQGAVQGYFER